MASPSPRQHPSDDELRLSLMAGIPDVKLAYQAIVDLARGTVAGYEVLARFEGGPLYASPDRWLAAAVRMGRARDLETAIWRASFEACTQLPPDTFLSINASPEFLASAECAALVDGRDSLERIVLEVTEHEAITDYDRLSASLSRFRARGAAIAVDDAGAGYASMSHVLALRPQFIKLDRAIVTDCDRDPAKAALVEMVGSFAGRIDSWLVAEGVEREGELATLTRMGVPLGQGYYLANPEPGWSGPSAGVVGYLLERASWRKARSLVSSLMEAAPVAETEEEALDFLTTNLHTDVVVLVDESRRPYCLAHREGPGVRLCPSVMRVHAGSDVRDVVMRAMTREAGARFDPIVCIRDDGSLHGLLRIEHLVEQLARPEKYESAA